MFIASYENTMRNARPKYIELPAPCPIVVERAERIARAKEAAEQLRVSERDERERRHREVLQKIEYSLNRYRQDRAPFVDKLPIREILKAICDYHCVGLGQLMGRNRQRFMTKVRDEAIRAVADARPDMSLPELGRVFNGRDHTTILHSLRKTTKPGFDYRGNKLPVDSVERQ